jgi:hypothetical protein
MPDTLKVLDLLVPDGRPTHEASAGPVECHFCGSALRDSTRAGSWRRWEACQLDALISLSKLSARFLFMAYKFYEFRKI